MRIWFFITPKSCFITKGEAHWDAYGHWRLNGIYLDLENGTVKTDAAITCTIQMSMRDMVVGQFIQYGEPMISSMHFDLAEPCLQ